MNYVNYIIFFIILLIIYHIYNKKYIKKTDTYLYNNIIDDINQKNEIESSFIKPKHKLHKILHKISNKNKINLSKDYVNRMYTKDTIDEILLEKIKNQIYIIFYQGLKLVYNVDYFLKDIVNVYEQVDFYGNNRYIVSLFLYDIKNYYNFKLLIDYVIIKGDLYVNYIGDDISSNLNLLNKYDYTMSNRGYLENNINIDKNIKEILNSYYSSNYKVIGYDTPSKNYSHYISKLDTIYKISDYSKIFLPKNIPTEYNPLFCKKSGIDWDDSGVFKKGQETCMVNNNSAFREPMSAFDSPGTYPKQQRTKSKEYGWLQGVDYNSGGVVTTGSGFY